MSQKLDMLGIGAAHSKDPNGIAWKQNKDFVNLLKRLNETDAVDGDSPSKLEDGDDVVGKEGGNGKTKEKRKPDQELDSVAERNAKRIRRKGVDDIKSKKSTTGVTRSTKVPESDDTIATTTPTYVPRHRAYVSCLSLWLELLLWMQTSRASHCLQKHGVEVNSSNIRNLGNCSYSLFFHGIERRYTI